MNNAPKASGQLDPTYGQGGVVSLPLPGVIENVPTAVFPLPENSSLVAIRAPAVQGVPSVLAKLNESGQLDKTYADLGIKRFQFSGGFFDPKKIVGWPDNNGVVVAGNAVRGFNDEVAVYKLLGNGQSDATFGVGGQVIYRPQNLSGSVEDSSADLDSAKATTGAAVDLGVAVHADGKIYVASSMLMNNFSGVVVCLDPSGAPSPGFNGGRVIVEPVAPHLQSYSHDVAVLPDGRVVVCGLCYGGPEGGNVGYVACYLPSGVRDLSFGQNGVVAVEETGVDVLNCLVVAQGKIFACGTASGAGLIISLNADGSYNHQFNGGQPLISRLPGFPANIVWLKCHVHNDSSGKVVVTGVANSSAVGTSLVIARYLPDASIDESFNGGGWTSFDDARGEDVPGGSALMRDNRVVIGGTLLMAQPVASYLRRYSA